MLFLASFANKLRHRHNEPGGKSKEEEQNMTMMEEEPLQQDRHAMERYAAAGAVFKAVYWLFRVADGL